MQPEPAGGSGVNYRRDVDGMRAVAVLLVVFDHLHVFFPGGYIGVDVFFVISGFLISSAILSEMSRDKFSIVSFYERRIRRIFPAMLATFVGAGILATLYFVPSEFEAFGQSMLAALFSVSNFLFWHQAGYFDAPSAMKPLLHTWSLAVEEQFYIIFPLFLMVARRWFPQRIRAAILTVAVISFGLACFWVRRDATTAFFIAPLRAWELLIGTIVSQRYLPAIRSTAARNVASLAGLLCIVVPAKLYSVLTPFPGYSALLPCVGAALIIAAGDHGPSLVGKLLGLRPVVFVGLISYSLYLWHWPILVFQNSAQFLWHPYGNKPTVLVVSLLAGYLSWKFIETPFRKGRFRPGRRHLFLGTGVVVAVITVLGVMIVRTGGFPSRFPAESLAVAKYMDFDPVPAFREHDCFMHSADTFAKDFKPAICLATDPSRKQYLLLGDSHAADLYAGLVRTFPEVNFSQATNASCRPLLNDPSPTTQSCKELMQFVFRKYLVDHKPDQVLLAGLWDDSEFATLTETVHYLRGLGIPVTVFGPGLLYNAALPRLVAVAIRSGDMGAVERNRIVQEQQFDRRLALMARNEWHVRYISVYEDLCAPACPAFASGNVPVLFDSNHYTPEGATLFAQAIRSRGQLP